MKHYEQVDFVEELLLDDTEGDASLHAANCDRCAAGRDGASIYLTDNRSDARRAADSRPEYFWTAQQEAISRRILLQARAKQVSFSWRRIAAIVIVSLGVGTAADSLTTPTAGGVPVAAVTGDSAQPFAVTAELEDENVTGSSDPWSSEELREFEQVIAWEEWQAEREGESL